jgi:hypothetical protein
MRPSQQASSAARWAAFDPRQWPPENTRYGDDQPDPIFMEVAMHLRGLMTALIALAAMTFFVAGAVAQTQVPAGPAAGASTAGSAPGRGPGARVGGDDPPGWAMMNSKERREHRAELRNAKTPEECRDIVARHHRQMIDRAQSLGRTPPLEPGRDPCAGLKK